MKLLGITLSSLALVACGGGGGGGGGDSVGATPDASTPVTAPVALSAFNYVDAGKEVMTGASSLQDTSSFTSQIFTGAQVVSSVTVPNFIKDKLPAVLQQFSQQKAQFSGATQTDSLICSTSGRIDLSFTDANGNNQPDRGDSVTLMAVNCNENGTVINGNMSLRFESVSGDVDYLPFAIEMSIVSNGLRMENVGESIVTSGSLIMNMNVQSSSQLSLGIYASNFVSTSTVNGIAKTYKQTNFAVNVNQDDALTTMTLKGAINVPSLGGNTVNVQTIAPITLINGGNPTSGQLMFSTNQGGTIRVLANGSQNAEMALDSNADGIYESSSTIAWNELF